MPDDDRELANQVDAIEQMMRWSEKLSDHLGGIPVTLTHEAMVIPVHATTGMGTWPDGSPFTLRTSWR